MSDDMLEYYRRELDYLRTQSADFAARYPKVAQRLVLNGDESADPHTERLIESVAFLTARVHRDLDRDFPAIASAMLDNLCPSLTQPVPAMTVVQMTLDSSQGKVTAGMPVARGAALSTTAHSGENCRFQVAWDTTLWPLSVGAIKLEDPRTLRLDLRCDSGVDVAELELDTLRLHLAGDLLTTMPLHEMLISELERIELQTQDGALWQLSLDNLREVGFAEDEAILAQPAHAHPAYALLQEYFAFPRKFQFFDLAGLRGRLGSGSGFSVRFVFARSARVLSQLGADTFRLGCVPAVNLFRVTSEPLRLDQRHYDYLLMPDYQRDAVMEIHSVLSVTVSDPRADRVRSIPSVFAESAPDGSDASDVFWSLRREMSLRKGISGSDVYLGFVDRRDVRTLPDEPVVYAQLLCTNRNLAAQVGPGTRFYGEGISSSTQIRALYQPSTQRAPVLEAKALWSLVSLLRLNHRSLVDGSTGVQTLQQMLMLFAGDSARDQAQVRGVTSLVASAATARVGRDTWRGHCRGTDIVLEFDADAFVGTSPLVLAGVLSRFFALYTSANSFVRLAVWRAGEPWMQWPAMSGRQCLT
ncbi:type VI secretion system baseplate subunit TssF [Janthinobacterium aquaticum]|uniref:type VI secretion system baseplate subunit TssF n=1 Tax=Janthinobacterium sp. FT58W TaxID=2654254 RepID=UPI00126405C5|nr:type VI secretion system baseplate subunit TssF [Janthinobacterium sp. FT58W]KAB8044236.1 type VI secretion system baseplate subunit TssF [Janthinobacterium sp. FT58W]